MAFVLERLGEETDVRGRYYCPAHDDRRPGGKPSADIWETADGDLLGCWSCGKRMGVIEVIETIGHCDSKHAIAMADEWLEHIPEKLPKRKKIKPLSPEQLAREYLVSTTNVRYPGDLDPLIKFCGSRRLPPIDYLRERWGWRGNFRGHVVMPWHDAKGDITGIRYRIPPDWAKSSRERSRFKYVYGTHQLLTNPNAGFATIKEVWLCEGETDCTWAAWHLEPQGIGVVAIGSASQRPTDADVQLFAGRRAVLALDPDGPGQAARMRWMSELAPFAKEIEVLSLENDLCGTKVTPLELRETIA
jgi:hypothetical protein